MDLNKPLTDQQCKEHICTLISNPCKLTRQQALNQKELFVGLIAEGKLSYSNLYVAGWIAILCDRIAELDNKP